MSPATPTPLPSPGAISLAPPGVALVAALVSRNVVLSLALGVYVGFTVAADYNPFLGVVGFLEEGLFAQLAQPSHAGLIVLILAIGGFIGLLERSGGMISFARQIAGWVRGQLGAQLAVWGSGIAIFFSDSATPLILGPVFRPVLRRVDVSMEKLAYIIDSTASPVCVLVPFISWGVYVMSLIDQAIVDLRLGGTSFEIFVGMLPYQFYPVLALLAVPLIVLTGRDFGPMARPAPRAESEQDTTVEEGPEAPSSTVYVPMATLMGGAAGLLLLGYYRHGRLTGSELTTSLTMAYGLATAVAMGLLRSQAGMPAKRSLANFRAGVERLLLIPLILLLAWSLGHTCQLVGTGRYLAGLSRAVITPTLLPATIFIIGAVISFAMGSAWGTFALLMPIAATIAHETGVGLRPALAAVTSGGLFGDHASPISDTTILASMGAGCRHIDHVWTQLPYALLPATISVAAFVVTATWQSRWILPAGVLVLATAVVLLARKLGSPTRGNPRPDEA
jgi:Na+/H+ antiporter NhaC